MVKLRLDPVCRLLLRRRRSCPRKWECILISWSRQGNIACTVLGSSWSSSSMPWRNTLSIMCSVRMWWSSVWISSAKDKQPHHRHTHQNYVTDCTVQQIAEESCTLRYKDELWLGCSPIDQICLTAHLKINMAVISHDGQMDFFFFFHRNLCSLSI